MRRAARKDQNHDLIAEAFRAMGWQVIEAYQFAQFCPGFPDLIVLRDGVVRFVEVKAPRGRLTADERGFHSLYSDYCLIVRSVEDIQKISPLVVNSPGG